MKKVNKVAVLLTGSLLLTQVASLGVNPVDAAAKTVTKKTTTIPSSNLNTLEKLSPIHLTSKSYAKLTDVNILAQDDGNILTYTLNIYNGDQRDIQLLDYWSKVKTKSGSILTTQLTSKDKLKKKVAPQSQVTLTYISKIGNIKSVNDLMVQLVKWDFSKPNYENTLGTFKIPANFTTLTSLGQTKKLRINDIPVLTKLENHQLYKTKDKIFTMVTLSMQNLGYKVIEDPKYSFNVVTTDGASYALSTDQTGANFKIQPQEIKNVQLIAELPIHAKTDKLKLQIVTSDEELKQNLPVATYSIPSGKSASLLVDGAAFKSLEVNGTKIETQIKNTTVSADEDTANWSFSLYLRNIGNQNVSFPKYEASLSSAEGYTFPISTKSFDNLSLKPLEEKTINLSASLPSYVKQDKVVLQLNQTAEVGADQKSKISFPVAFYSLPYMEQVAATDDTLYSVENEYGKYNLKLSSIQMLPWADGDLVSAKFTVMNTKATTVKLPQLAGVLKLDQASLSTDTQVVTTANSMILGPYGSADLYLIAKVPNGLDFKQAMITLQEKNGDNLLDFLTVNARKTQAAIPTVSKGSEYHIKTAGKNAEVKERRTVFYSGVSSNVMFTELEVKSEETRQADLSQLVGYYTTKDGQVFKASVGQPEGSTSPNGKNLVTLWAKLPRNLDTTDMVLYLGEGINEGKFTAPKGESKGYVNAVALELNQQKLEPKRNSLSGIDLFPYNLSIPNLSGTLTGSGVNVKFDYYLSRNGEYEIGTYDHKLVLELRDSSGKYFEQELALEQDLKIGDNQTYSLSFSNSLFEDKQAGSFEISLYDKFQGEKVKLASQAYYYSAPVHFGSK
ncbi:hypothetical protein ACFQ3W_25165 [Paenibacillus puldeungensis]|uniref:Uncharacterized protein n=1 Tax=Paenibacillus puldeungensis TaxID=696536 RepID=A0ABW3S4Y7_9BACL